MDDSAFERPQAPAKVIDLSADAKEAIVRTTVTCPFLGAAVQTGALAVRNDAGNPLAAIDDVRAIGNAGGGDLGDLLVFFATGNHAFMRGASGKLDAPVPEELFSLDLPGSQGSHPGHSGILQGDPRVLGSGRFSQADFDRLVARARDGVVKRSDVGRFIGESLARDPDSKVLSSGVAGFLARDLASFVVTLGPAMLQSLDGPDEDSERAHREVEEKLTKLLGEDNLVGSAGEFGLLFAFLVNKPGAPTVDGEPALAVDDLRAMFVDKRFPRGSDTWKKRKVDWVKNTTALLVSAGKEYLALRKRAH